MGDNSYKGMGITLDGSNSGDYPYITKLDYGPATELVYIAECKYGVLDDDRKHYIEKFYYNSTYSVIAIKIAQNKVNANATQVSITTDDDYVYLTLTPGNGDFSEVLSSAKPNTKDSIYLKTPTQTINNVPVEPVDQYTVKIKKEYNLNNIVDELNAPISKWDLMITMNNELTKDFNKRKWSMRDRYLYA